jgi:hypothetical protein
MMAQQLTGGNASAGRVYNAYNGGEDNFEADRALAGEVVAIAPDAAARLPRPAEAGLRRSARCPPCSAGRNASAVTRSG